MTDKERELELEIEKLKVFMERLSNSFIEIKEILKTKVNKSDLNNKADKSDLNNKADKSDLNNKADKWEILWFFNSGDGTVALKNSRILDLNNKRILGLAKPEYYSDAVTKEYVDNKLKNLNQVNHNQDYFNLKK